MIKRLFILLLFTSCYNSERECNQFMTGEFEFSYKINDTVQKSRFTRTLNYEIEEYNGIIDSSSTKRIVFLVKTNIKINSLISV